MKHFDKEFIFFKNRKGRADFISKKFDREISQSERILDVGCDYNSLKIIVGPKVTGVDIYGEPDLRVDLEKEKLMRFKDGEFDLIVCTEVLEHLDNFYEMIDELFRVSNKYILISLPNCLDIFTKWNIIFQSHLGKFYELPLNEPEDRHKWIFNYLDIDNFFELYCKKNNYIIEQKFLHCNYSYSWKGQLVRTIVRLLRLNNASQSYWIVIKK
jgi:hypothetical protein